MHAVLGTFGNCRKHRSIVSKIGSLQRMAGKACSTESAIENSFHQTMQQSLNTILKSRFIDFLLSIFFPIIDRFSPNSATSRMSLSKRSHHPVSINAVAAPLRGRMFMLAFPSPRESTPCRWKKDSGMKFPARSRTKSRSCNGWNGAKYFWYYSCTYGMDSYCFHMLFVESFVRYARRKEPLLLKYHCTRLTGAYYSKRIANARD